MLYNVTYPNSRIEYSSRLENSEILKKIKDKNDLKNLIKIIDEALNNLKPSVSSKLTWTKFAALFGHSKYTVAEEINKNLFWEILDKYYNSDYVRMAGGTLLLWRVALRAEKTGEIWFRYAQKLGDKKDPISGKPITESHYWISEVPPTDFKRKTKNSINDLKNKWKIV